MKYKRALLYLRQLRGAGVYINSLCGKCRVPVTSGNAKADKHAIGFFSGEAIRSGYVLACQTRVEDNLGVLIPAKSRPEMEKIVTGGAQNGPRTGFGIHESYAFHEALRISTGRLFKGIESILGGRDVGITRS